MVGSGHIDKGAIYSIAGDSKWAASAGFEVRLHNQQPSSNIEDFMLESPEVLIHRERTVD